MTLTGFFAYPSHEVLDEIIERGVSRANNLGKLLGLTCWPQLDPAGCFIANEVTQKIDASDIVFGDITFPNFNVFYELGYAFGRHKQVVPTRCVAFDDKKKLIDRLGLFDTVGQIRYDNSDSLAQLLAKYETAKPLNFPPKALDASRPIFLLEPRIKSEGTIKVKRRLELLGLQSRSFDPVEEPRLALSFAYVHVQQSLAVVTHLVSTDEAEFEDSNLRSAFVIGLAHGMRKQTLILQRGSSPVPLDYRDFVSQYSSDSQLDSVFSPLGPSVLKALQSGPKIHSPGTTTLLERIDLGSLAAENEAEKLRDYYLQTDQARQVLAGNARLVVGRKGTGKSALFFHARDAISEDRRNLVIALRPDGALVKRFKELIQITLDDPAKDHVATAFWEYVFLLETLRSFLDHDRQSHIHNHHIRDLYTVLTSLLDEHGGSEAIDFTDLLINLIRRLSEELPRLSTSGLLTSSQITSAMYASDIARLRDGVRSYIAARKVHPWILIDNLDKGWPTRGVTSDDVVILRGVIDASQKLEQFMGRSSVSFSVVAFIRNDVYENLVNDTPDRGKESRVSLDWHDRSLLKELLRRRLLVSGSFDEEETFDQIWRQLCVSTVDGTDSADYILDRAMMRPRNLISIVSYCRSSSVNFRRGKITSEDIKSALRSYSSDVTRELGYEIRDIYPDAEDVLYTFLGFDSRSTVLAVTYALRAEMPDGIDVDILIELLFWFGFLGVVVSRSGLAPSEIYVSDADYDLKKLLKLARGLSDPDTEVCINAAFWPFLEIAETTVH